MQFDFFDEEGNQFDFFFFFFFDEQVNQFDEY